MQKPCLLAILDGYGIAPESPFNAVRQAQTPFLHYWLQRPHRCSLLQAAGQAVGLPEGQMGNSEVGHLHIGAGREVLQGLPLIDAQLANPQLLSSNPLLSSLLKNLARKPGHIHLIGILSPGGVHGHEGHILLMARRLQKVAGVQAIWIHAILDGRDVPPRSALRSLKLIENLPDSPPIRCASLMGRFYAMDRDRRWERTEKAYQAIVQKKADHHALTASEALEKAYQRGETDEFCSPTLCAEFPTLGRCDRTIFMNFRADRARQLALALANPQGSFQSFPCVSPDAQSPLLTLTEYDEQLSHLAIFPQATVPMTLGETIAKAGLRQLRVSETEKFAHVTYFLNGNRREPFEGEERCLIPSNRQVKTYDLDPEMQCLAITQKVEAALKSQQHGAIFCNFPNADMVGHTGNYPATLKALEAVDHCLYSIAETAKQNGYAFLITADHGNAESMFDPIAQQPQTAHTSNPVPLLYPYDEGAGLKPEGSLIDVAPTLLSLLELERPPEMQGQSLWEDLF